MLKGYNVYSVQANVKGEERIMLTGRSISNVGFGSRAINTTSSIAGPAISSANSPTGYGLTGGALATPHLYETLAGFLPDENQNGQLYRKLYKDIYNYDTICGAAVDLKSNLPFSDFTLTGVSSPERLQKYLKSVENIYITKQLPSIAVDYQAIGAYLGSLNLDEKDGIFTSLMSHDLDQCKFQWLPFAGCDPIIDIQFGNDFKKMMTSKDPRIKNMVSLLPDYIQAGLKKGAVELEPGSTLYVPRRGLSSDYKGQSVFKRVLTIHLVEKALIKGTIEQSMRRQRPILHVTCLSGNTKLSTSKGIIKMKDIVPHVSNGIPQSWDVDIKVKGKDGKLQEVEKFLYQGDKQTVKVYTKAGRELVCTPDHKVRVVDENGFSFVEAKDLLGKKVCVDIADYNLLPVKGIKDFIEQSQVKVFLDEVVNIVPYKKIPVYDLTMKDHNNPYFIANGIFVHNCGSDTWEPTQQELSNIANLFRDADMDPINATVVTRQDITSQDVKDHSSMWKWEDMFEFASSAKMRALGINESFLSGDATYSTMETALSVFLEDLRSMRDYMTAEIFYDKMFPAIAVINDFKTQKDRFSVTSNYKNNCFMGQRNSGIFKNNNGNYIAVSGGGLHHSIYEIEDITKYEIPTIHWHKELKPEADKDYMDILVSLQEQGLPIPLRMWAAAGGVSMDELLSDVEEDKKIRNKIAQLTGVPQSGDTMGMEDMMNTEFSSVKKLKNLVTSTVLNKTGKRPLLSRDYGDKLSPGKINNQNILVPASKRQQNIINEKVNKLCASVLADLGTRQNYEEKKKYAELSEQKTSKTYI